jgi:hypothetical protein
MIGMPSKLVLADDSPLSSTHVIRALFIAAKALELIAAKAERSAATPTNAGKSWRDEEDQRLVAAALERGVSLSDLVLPDRCEPPDLIVVRVLKLQVHRAASQGCVACR